MVVISDEDRQNLKKEKDSACLEGLAWRDKENAAASVAKIKEAIRRLSNQDLSVEIADINKNISLTVQELSIAEKDLKSRKKLLKRRRKDRRQKNTNNSRLRDSIANQLGISEYINILVVTIDYEDVIHVRYNEDNDNNDFVKRHHFIIYRDGKVVTKRAKTRRDDDVDGWAEFNLGFKSPKRY